jgi:uroporphyrin-III C-methyltransferase/precorrin-2 dehydrogenase/sirohydrochlorin ferrochelatase
MRFLPIFLDPRAGTVVLVGGGEAARAKLRLLLSAEARVRWHAGDGDHDLSGLEVGAAARVVRDGRDPLTADLSGVIAVICAGAGDLGRAVAARARAHGIPVNVMDEPAHSTFIFPAVVDRGEVVVAVGTGGASPVVARRVRERIEALLPARLGELAGFVGRWRKTVQGRIPDFSQRRRFWERVVDGPIGAEVLAGRSDAAARSLAAIRDPAAYASDLAGFVTLVGAGPGDPDLLTIKALRALQDADVIFHDDLVSAEVLDRARRDAERVPVGRRAGQPGIGQDAINRLLIEAARAGRRVVRLKGGDPFVFGRGGEEIAALREAGVACAVVPGITAGLGAAAAFEVPLTYRREALRITFLTAHRAQDAGTVDWSALTDIGMTVVVYMGITAAPVIRDGLIAAGRSPHTPVGVFARVTRPDAHAVTGTLDDLPALAAQVGNGPAILIIGDVVARSAPWRAAHPRGFLSDLPMAAE